MGNPLTIPIDFTSLTRHLVPKLITHWLKYCLCYYSFYLNLNAACTPSPVYSLFWTKRDQVVAPHSLSFLKGRSTQWCWDFSPHENIYFPGYHLICFPRTRKSSTVKSEEGAFSPAHEFSRIYQEQAWGWHSYLWPSAALAALHLPSCLLYLLALSGIPFYTTPNFSRRKGIDTTVAILLPQVYLI